MYSSIYEYEWAYTAMSEPRRGISRSWVSLSTLAFENRNNFV